MYFCVNERICAILRDSGLIQYLCYRCKGTNDGRIDAIRMAFSAVATA